MDRRAGLWLVLAAEHCGQLPGLEALPAWWSLALQHERMVLAIGLFVGLGAISLWPMVLRTATRLGLDSRLHLGPELGHLASRAGLLRLGTFAAANTFPSGNWVLLFRP
jgi:hypothetical protein